MAELEAAALSAAGTSLSRDKRAASSVARVSLAVTPCLYPQAALLFFSSCVIVGAVSPLRGLGGREANIRGV